MEGIWDAEVTAIILNASAINPFLSDEESHSAFATLALLFPANGTRTEREIHHNRSYDAWKNKFDKSGNSKSALRTVLQFFVLMSMMRGTYGHSDPDLARCETLCNNDSFQEHCERCLLRLPMRFGKRSEGNIVQPSEAPEAPITGYFFRDGELWFKRKKTNDGSLEDVPMPTADRRFQKPTTTGNAEGSWSMMNDPRPTSLLPRKGFSSDLWDPQSPEDVVPERAVRKRPPELRNFLLRIYAPRSISPSSETGCRKMTKFQKNLAKRAIPRRNFSLDKTSIS